MKRLALCLLLPALAGCMTASVPEIGYWPIEYQGKAQALAAKPLAKVVRIKQVMVRAPYDDAQLVVLRENGTVALDPYNEFVAPPVKLLKGLLYDACVASGRFGAVISSSSSATEEVALELQVYRVALDCRQAGKREARVEVRLQLLKGRELVSTADGAGCADTAEGNFGRAYSQAFSQALDEAIRAL